MKTDRQDLKILFSAVLLLALVSGSLLLTRVDRSSLRQSNSVSDSPIKQVVNDEAPLATSQTIGDIFRASITETHFEPESVEEAKVFASLVQRLLDDRAPNPSAKQWLDYGWVVHHDQAMDCILIAEHPSRRVGRGLYAIRTGNALPVMIQAPHRFHDRKTGVITRKLFESFQVRASAWNTVHRSRHDIAHSTGSHFNAFTRVVIESYSETVNFQLHGFDNEKIDGQSKDGPTALAIVSNATRTPGRQAKAFAKKLKSAWGQDRVWLFPLETTDLGATTNTQAALMRENGNTNFLHVELAMEIREKLANSESAREKFFNTIEARLAIE